MNLNYFTYKQVPNKTPKWGGNWKEANHLGTWMEVITIMNVIIKLRDGGAFISLK